MGLHHPQKRQERDGGHCLNPGSKSVTSPDPLQLFDELKEQLGGVDPDCVRLNLFTRLVVAQGGIHLPVLDHNYPHVIRVSAVTKDERAALAKYGMVSITDSSLPKPADDVDILMDTVPYSFSEGYRHWFAGQHENSQFVARVRESLQRTLGEGAASVLLPRTLYLRDVGNDLFGSPMADLITCITRPSHYPFDRAHYHEGHRKRLVDVVNGVQTYLYIGDGGKLPSMNSENRAIRRLETNLVRHLKESNPDAFITSYESYVALATRLIDYYRNPNPGTNEGFSVLAPEHSITAFPTEALMAYGYHCEGIETKKVRATIIASW